MVLFAFDAYASLAGITMEGFVTTSDAAYSALVAMIDFLLNLIIVEEITDTAEVGSKLYVTIFAVLLWFLYMLTIQAFDFLYIMST